MQSTHKKILEIIGLYVASWALVCLTSNILHVQFISIMASIVAISVVSCFLFIILGVTSITIKKVENKIYCKTKHTNSSIEESSNTTLRVVGAYVVSLSFTANIFFLTDSLHMIFDRVGLVFLQMSLTSTAIMIFLLATQTIYKNIRNKKRK